MLEFQNTKTFLLKDTLQNWSEEIFVISKIKIQFGGFTCKKLAKKNSEQKKYLKEKGDKLCVKWKEYDSRFNSWIDKKDLI